jgi:hypothetical protein
MDIRPNDKTLDGRCADSEVLEGWRGGARCRVPLTSGPWRCARPAGSILSPSGQQEQIWQGLGLICGRTVTVVRVGLSCISTKAAHQAVANLVVAIGPGALLVAVAPPGCWYCHQVLHIGGWV